MISRFFSPIRWALPLVLGSAPLFLWGCDGGATDTETLEFAVAGRVLDEAGMPASGARVKLLPADYDPSLSTQEDGDSLSITVCDKGGIFRFQTGDRSRAFQIIASHPTKALWASHQAVSRRESLITLETLALKPPLSFEFILETPTYAVNDSGIAYFPGTDIWVRCQSAFASRVDSVPADLRRLIVRSKAGWQHEAHLSNLKDSNQVIATPDGLLIGN